MDLITIPKIYINTSLQQMMPLLFMLFSKQGRYLKKEEKITSKVPSCPQSRKKYEQLMHTIFVDLIELWSVVDW